MVELDPFFTQHGFKIESMGGGFESWLLEVVHDEHTHDMTTEFRLINTGTGSAPKTGFDKAQPAIVEVSIQDLSYDAPQEAVAILEARGLTGGSNGCSGALSWHFLSVYQAVSWVVMTLRDYGGTR